MALRLWGIKMVFEVIKNQNFDRFQLFKKITKHCGRILISQILLNLVAVDDCV